MNLRCFTDDGINEFRKYLQELRQDPSKQKPILNNPPYSEEFHPNIEVEDSPSFQTRLELAQYLDRKFRNANLEREAVIATPHLFTWLAYFWFDLICPPLAPSARKVREVARYICSTDYTDYYRHLIAAAYQIYSLHENNSKLFLHSPVYEHNDFVEQFASRQFIISHKGIVEAAHILYWDVNRDKPKRGAQSRERPGTHKRFVRIIQQYELTYDIFHMSAQQIINLLPPEFDEWKR